MTHAPYLEHREHVPPEWADRNGVLRPAFAVVIFDHAIDVLYDGLGIGWPYRRQTDFSTFTLETHTLLERSMFAGDDLLVRNHVLAVDGKRMHIAQEMFRAGESVRSALMEQLSIHVDLAIRRSAPFPPERRAAIEAAAAAQSDWPRPRGTGARVGLVSVGISWQARNK